MTGLPLPRRRTQGSGAAARTADAARLFQTLGQAGILVRRFAEHPTWLRFGLPGNESDWQRLERALAP